MAIPVIDAHWHIDDPLTAPVSFADQFFPDDLDRVAEDVNLVGSVHMQRSYDQPRTLYETTRCERLRLENAKGSPNVFVIWASLDRGAEFCERLLLEHFKLSDRVRGVRHTVTYRSKYDAGNKLPNEFKNPNFVESFPLLEKYGLTFDTNCYAYQIRDVADLAKKFPNQKIIMNHFGGAYGVDDSTSNDRNSREIKSISPHEQEIEFNAWKADITKIAELPNMYIKISGLATPYTLAMRQIVDGRECTLENLTEAFYPFVEHAVRSFRVDRCIWASNFPPDGELVTYSTNWNAYRLCMERLGLSLEDQTKIFHDNAVEFYRIPLEGDQMEVKFESPAEVYKPVAIVNAASRDKCCSACGQAVQLGVRSKCGRCKRVLYCSRECQRKDWPTHKPKCVAKS